MTKAYMEKENTFGIFLKEHRLKLEVTLEQLSEGLCSVSELARIEAGTRAAGKALQDRLLYRLGISPDLYEIFLFQDDYSRWKKRQQLLYAVTRMSAEEAGRLLLEYREQYEDAAKADVDRRLERQFCLTMEAQILRNQTNETEQPGLHRLQEKRLGDLFREALALTVDPGLFSRTAIQGLPTENGQAPGNGMEFLLYSVQELDLLLEWLHYERPQDWKQCYREVLHLTEDMRFDSLSRAEIYSKTVYYLYRDTLGREGLAEKLEAFSLCRNAVQCLREAGRTYYLWELLKLSVSLARDIASAQSAAGAEQQAKELESRIHQWQEWSEALEAVYSEFGIPVETKDSCWLYVEKEVYCLNDVIRIRRKMLGISREQLCQNGILCSEKTLMRLENGKTKAQREIVKELMKGLNLSAEFCRIELVTGDPVVPGLMDELRNCIMNRDGGQIEQLVDQIRERISLDIPSNRQAMMRAQALCEIYKGVIAEEKYIGQFRDALTCTLSYEDAMKPGEKYLTNEEISCIQNMVCRKKDMDEEKIQQITLLEELYKSCEKDNLIFCFINMYEFIMGTVASEWGNMGKYDHSDEISRNIIKECLYQRRTNGVHNGIYNIMWNDKQRQKKGIPSPAKHNPEEDLRHCIVFSQLGCEGYDEEFYRKKLDALFF